MTQFTLDGKHHAVAHNDTIVMVGPGTFVGERSGLISLGPKQTLTMLCSRMRPGEQIVITCNLLPPTVFTQSIQMDMA